MDNAGNSGSASATYSVHYDWNGFFRPIDNYPVVNSVKAGSAVPIKFNLGGNQGLDIFAPGYPRWKTVECGFTPFVDAIEETVTAGFSTLTYDALASQYVYVTKTDKLWTGCRELQVQLKDGTTHVATFKFFK
jgi:hypothetical protein